MKTIHPGIAEHAMEENERLRGLLREIAEGCTRRDMPSEQTVTKWADRIDAALSQQAEPVEPKCRPCGDVGIIGHSTICPECADTWSSPVEQVEPAPAQDGRLSIQCPPSHPADSYKTGTHVVHVSLVHGLIRQHDRIVAALTRPAQTEQQPVARANRGKHAFWVRWTDAAEGMYGQIDLYAAPIAQTAPHESEHHVQLLGQALGECIAAAGIIRPDASLSGPELLMFADDLKRHPAEQTEQQPEQSGLEGLLRQVIDELDGLNCAYRDIVDECAEPEEEAERCDATDELIDRARAALSAQRGEQ